MPISTPMGSSVISARCVLTPNQSQIAKLTTTTQFGQIVRYVILFGRCLMDYTIATQCTSDEKRARSKSRIRIRFISSTRSRHVLRHLTFSFYFLCDATAARAMHSMNGVTLGNKQVIVRLHEPKQLRQEKLAQRFGGHNNHPRSASGATSPTLSEGNDSFTGWPSPGRAHPGLTTSSPPNERVRRSSGSYYHVRTSTARVMRRSNIS
jgi:hypothetical protein